jgi:pimeloyl-ACP methyl ester carboxylesterase
VGGQSGLGQDQSTGVMGPTIRITDPAIASYDQQGQLVAWKSHQSVKEGAVTTMNANTPTIVFVHGAWADATGFGGSMRALSDRGFAAIGFANPLRHLTGNAAYLAALLQTISGRSS